MLTKSEIQKFIIAISSLHWHTDFYQFCQILNFNPDYQYTQEKWQQFQQLNKALNYFDLDCLTKMVEAYQKTTV